MGHSHCNDLVDTGLIIVIIAKPPVVVVSMAKVPAIAAAAPGVGTQYGVTLLCESLDRVHTSRRREVLGKHSRRSSMDIQDEGISLSGLVVHGIRQQSFNFLPIF